MSGLRQKELRALLILNSVDAFGSIRTRKLLAFFGSAERVLAASGSELASCGTITPVMSQRLKEAKKRFNPEQELQEAAQNGIRVMTVFDRDYPRLLKEIYDPPIILYVKGSFELCDRNAIGIVGSRGASFYGLSCAKEFSHALNKAGLTIVSGMARGIDTAAHRAALDAGGRTIAVLGSGLLEVYPPENNGLFVEIAKKGAVISEFPLCTEPRPQNFPIRNRVISGLSVGLLVVEASQKSGALISARFASEQGRQVFAIPGKVSSETSCGTNELIKDGARLVTTPREILEDLRFNFTFHEPAAAEAASAPDSPAGTVGLEPQEAAVVSFLSDEPMGLDDIAQATGLGASRLLAILTNLELKRAVRRLSGSMFVKPL